jgi:hypothetical protein
MTDILNYFCTLYALFTFGSPEPVFVNVKEHRNRFRGMIPTAWELIPGLHKWLKNTGSVVRRQWVDEKIAQHRLYTLR